MNKVESKDEGEYVVDPYDDKCAVKRGRPSNFDIERNEELQRREKAKEIEDLRKEEEGADLSVQQLSRHVKILNGKISNYLDHIWELEEQHSRDQELI